MPSDHLFAGRSHVGERPRLFSWVALACRLHGKTRPQCSWGRRLRDLRSGGAHFRGTCRPNSLDVRRHGDSLVGSTFPCGAGRIVGVVVARCGNRFYRSVGHCSAPGLSATCPWRAGSSEARGGTGFYSFILSARHTMLMLTGATWICTRMLLTSPLLT